MHAWVVRVRHEQRVHLVSLDHMQAQAHHHISHARLSTQGDLFAKSSNDAEHRQNKDALYTRLSWQLLRTNVAETRLTIAV
jgi:hypothetical protein